MTKTWLGCSFLIFILMVSTSLLLLFTPVFLPWAPDGDQKALNCIPGMQGVPPPKFWQHLHSQDMPMQRPWHFDIAVTWFVFMVEPVLQTDPEFSVGHSPKFVNNSHF